MKKVNSKTDKKIEIIEQDNCKAVRKDHQNCVIARAIKRKMKAEWVDVGASRVLVKRKNVNRIERFLLPPLAQQQVRFFDRKGQFAPCRIVLKAPPRATGLRTGKNARSGPSGKKNKTLATR